MSATAKWYLNVIVSLGFMVFFRFIPAPDPMTPLGMTVLGIFIGCIYGWCTTNLIWPSLAGLIIFGFTEFTNPTAAWGTLMSNGTVALAIWLMIAVGLLNNTGLTQYLANWSITRKFTKGKPWTLITVVYLATIICGSIINAIGTVLIFWALIWAICDKVGIKKGGKASAWMCFSIVLLATTGTFIMPFQLPVITCFGFLASGSGGAYDGTFSYTAYLAFTITVQTVILIAYMLLSKYVLKIDLSELANYEPDSYDIGKFTKKQKAGLILFAIMFLLLMAPSFLPQGFVVQSLTTTLGSVGACILVVAIACCIQIDGETFVDFSELFSKNVNWGVTLLYGTALVLSTCINSPDSGIMLWVQSLLNPILGGLSPLLFVVVFMALAMFITNLINNVVVAAIMVPISWTFSTALGLNPIAVVACFTLFVDFAIFLPSASPSGAMMHSNEGWIPKKLLYKYAFIALVMLFVVTIIVAWPLSNVLF